MNKNTAICPDCNKTFSTSNISKHIGSKSCKKNDILPKFIVLENGDCKCNECGLVYNKHGIKSHIYRKHTEEGLKFNPFHDPNIGFKNGTRSAWNKGLSKETNDILKRRGEKVSLIMKGRPGKKKTEEEKKKLSEAAIRYYEKNPDKIPYRLNHSSKESYPEKIVREYFEANNITGWVQEYPFGRFSLDFAFVDKKIDIEIDGSTHLQEKIIIKDIRRDKILIDSGWKVLRITAKELKNNFKQCIDKIILFVNL